MQFYVVYIREAHPVDGPDPIAGGPAPIVEDPLHYGERRQVAQTCMRALELEGLPSLVDDVDDAAARAYEAWPDRLVLVDVDGRVVLQSKPGPVGFDPEELELAIRALLAL